MRRLLPATAAVVLVLQGCNHDVSVIRRDDDGDGYYGDDCDDHSAEIYPGAPEICDGIDNNCDGQIDEDLTQIRYPDDDDDGFGVAALGEDVCGEPSGYTEVVGDCDDDDPEVHPDATEVCDSVDNDCDGDIDEELAQTWYTDGDGDLHGDPDNPKDFCEDPGVGFTQDPADDCDDTDPASYPGATEICGDDIDQDCNGSDKFCAIQGELELDADANVSIYGESSGDTLGGGLSLGPDIDGDGRTELWIGAPMSNYENGGFHAISLNEGVEAAVIQMPTTGSSSYSVQTVVSTTNNGEVGTQIVPTGDLDGDGLEDLLVSAPKSRNFEAEVLGAGASYVYLASSFSEASDAMGDADMIIYGQTRTAYASTSAGTLGDLDGDGFPELFVGEPKGDGDWSNDAGNVYIFQSCPQGIGGCWDMDGDGNSDVMSAWGPGSYVEVEDADAILSGSATDDYVGSAVTAVPDLYGDGSSALVVGASGISTVYLIDGYPFASTRIDSAADTVLLGAETPESGGAGTSLANAGDLNADGYTDLLIGAPGEAADAGRVYVVFGRSQVDFDAFGGTLELATWADSDFTGENSGDAAGTAISGIGDQNLDGCDDFIIGAPGVDYEGMSDSGAVYLMLGHPTDMGLGIHEMAHLSGSWEGGELGSDIDGSDDLNGDGFRDLLIGAPSYNDAGAAFVLFGGSL